MGSVVTVMNMKGGVGKTTAAMHIGGLIGRNPIQAKRRKVLLIDYDPQFNLSQALLPAKRYFELEKTRKTTISVLFDNDADLNPYKLQVPGNHEPPSVVDVATKIYQYKDGKGGLDLLPSTLDLMYVALGQADGQISPIEERFEKFIKECRTIYDLVFIDCHPAGSLFTKTSLRNSDHVIIPVVPQRYAVRGIGLMMNFINAKKLGTTGPTPHILFNLTSRVDTSSQETEIRSKPEFAAHCMKSTLKKYSAFSEPEGGLGFVWSSKKPYSTSAFLNLYGVASEFLTRIGA